MPEEQNEEIKQIINKIYERAEKERLDNQDMEYYYTIKEIANDIDLYKISLKDTKEILKHVNLGSTLSAKKIINTYR